MSSRLILTLYAIVTLGPFTTPASSSAQAAGTGRCAEDRTITVCVTSAALTPHAGWGAKTGDVTVSVTLKITDKLDYPVDLAFSGGGWGTWAFTPQDSESIPNAGAWTTSGLQVCGAVNNCALTTLSPGASLLAQIHYRGNVNPNGLPLLQIASTAAFVSSLLIVERGKPRTVSVDLEGFTFGNALPSVR